MSLGNFANETGEETSTLTYFATGTVEYTENGVTDGGGPPGGGGVAPPHPINMGLLIFMYIVIFILAVVGNILVIMTLVHNKRMRTVTNVFLFSLAVSDVLFAMVCMPFTLVGNILQRFIFGAGICKIVPYFQGVSVTVSVWTMVAISLERYHAICNPLSSRTWQTKRHAYRAIAAIWLVGGLLFIPSIVFTQLIPINAEGTKHMCREIWPHEIFKKVFLTSIFVILMVIPLLTMAMAYGLIIVELRRGMQVERGRKEKEENGTPLSENITKLGDSEDSTMLQSVKKAKKKETRQIPRSTSTSDAKKRVVKMLIVIVVLFFICWAPLWCLTMWSVYDPETAHSTVSAVEIAFIKWLIYVSACVNPIVYCFMNKKFRQGFLEAFGCCGAKREKVINNTMVSGGDSRYQSTRRQTVNNNRTTPTVTVTSYTHVSSDDSV